MLAEYESRKHKLTFEELAAQLKDLGIQTDHSAPAVKILNETSRAEAKQQHITFESDPGIWLDGTLYIPSSQARKPAVLMVKGENLSGIMPTEKIAEAMAAQGEVVLLMEPRTSSLRADTDFVHIPASG